MRTPREDPVGGVLIFPARTRPSLLPFNDWDSRISGAYAYGCRSVRQILKRPNPTAIQGVPAPYACPWMPRQDGLALTVRLRPKSARDAVGGLDQLADGRTVPKVRVRALPEAGAANAALTRLLSKVLAMPGSAISLESGASGRVKILVLKSDVAALEARLTALSSAD